MKLDVFKSVISKGGGVARQNQFFVSLPSLTYDASDLNILCASVNLPGRQILTMERLIGLKGRKMPNGFASDDVSMTFYVLNDYKVKKYFEDWQNRVINQNTYEVGYPEDYVQDVTISQLQKGLAFDFPIDKIFGINIDVDVRTKAKVVYQCKLLDAYPTSMSAIELNNEMDGLIQLNVQLSYRNWVSDTNVRSNVQLDNSPSRELPRVGR